MSVYTEVSREALVEFLQCYAVGDLVSHKGISGGIENTNYFVTTSTGEYVLTLFEHHEIGELGYFLALMAFYADHDILCASPLADKTGQHLSMLCNRPAALVNRLNGAGIEVIPTVAQCRVLGDVLGRMQSAGQGFTQRRVTTRGSIWRNDAVAQLLPVVDVETADLLRTEQAAQADYDALALPNGVTHSDLFRDNALFAGDTLAGVIDFYYACDEYLLYDLAVVVNDWCMDGDGKIDMPRYAALMTAYQAQRAVTDAERDAWSVVLRVAAMRFCLSRLLDSHFPREGELTQTKPPAEFLAILRQHQQGVPAL